MINKNEKKQKVITAFKAFMSGNPLSENDQKIILENSCEVILRVHNVPNEQEN